MRRRFQAGSVTRSTDGRYWVGKYRTADKKHKSKLLGKVSQMTKSEAREKLAAILRPVNASVDGVGPTVRAFLEDVYFPFFERKWKPSTYQTNRDRVMREIAGTFGDRLLATLGREELQEFLDSKAGLSYSTTGHLRWDLKQMFNVALAEGLVTKNPAAFLFVPRGCRKPKRPVMTIEQVRAAIDALELRERLVFKFAVLAGMRPGEIFGLRRGRVLDQVVDIQEGVYRGKVGTPKTPRSVRQVALTACLRADVEAWLEVSPGEGPESWLFPSERFVTPLSRDNFMARHLRPALKAVGLGWVSYQCMRRTHATLMRDLGVDPKVVADVMGHGIGVGLDVYTQTPIAARQKAAETLGLALVH